MCFYIKLYTPTGIFFLISKLLKEISYFYIYDISKISEINTYYICLHSIYKTINYMFFNYHNILLLRVNAVTWFVRELIDMFGYLNQNYKYIIDTRRLLLDYTMQRGIFNILLNIYNFFFFINIIYLLLFISLKFNSVLYAGIIEILWVNLIFLNILLFTYYDNLNFILILILIFIIAAVELAILLVYIFQKYNH